MVKFNPPTLEGGEMKTIQWERLRWALDELSDKRQQELLWLGQVEGEMSTFEEWICGVFTDSGLDEVLYHNRQVLGFTPEMRLLAEKLSKLVAKLPKSGHPSEVIDHPVMPEVREVAKAFLLSFDDKIEKLIETSASLERGKTFARQGLGGEIHMFLACIEISNETKNLAYVPREITVVFDGIASEVDGLPIGSERLHWDAAALEEQDKEIERYLGEVKPVLRDAMRKLLAVN
jgi:hypothetical protein